MLLKLFLGETIKTIWNLIFVKIPKNIIFINYDLFFDIIIFLMI